MKKSKSKLTFFFLASLFWYLVLTSLSINYTVKIKVSKHMYNTNNLITIGRDLPYNFSFSESRFEIFRFSQIKLSLLFGSILCLPKIGTFLIPFCIFVHFWGITHHAKIIKSQITINGILCSMNIQLKP